MGLEHFNLLKNVVLIKTALSYFWTGVNLGNLIKNLDLVFFVFYEHFT